MAATHETPEQLPLGIRKSLLPIDGVPGKLMPLQPPEPPLVPRRKMRFRILLVAPFIVLLLLVGGMLLLNSFWQTSRTAVILVTPRAVDYQQSEYVQAGIGTPTALGGVVSARRMTAFASSRQATTPSTGVGQQSVRVAMGEVTFYNIDSKMLIVASGSILTTKGGVQVRTLVQASVPPGNGPLQGQITVPARAVSPGVEGNIPAHALYAAQCCDTAFINGIVASNQQAFAGGQDASTFAVVEQQNINAASSLLIKQGTQAAQAALQTQVRPDEELVPLSVSCTSTIQPDHPVGSRAEKVTVTVQVTCNGESYNRHTAIGLATANFTKQARDALGTGYALIGPITVVSVHMTIVDAVKGSLAILVPLHARWMYQVTQEMLHRLLPQIAEMSRDQARARLLSMTGIEHVAFAGSSGDTLPQASHITFTVVTPQ